MAESVYLLDTEAFLALQSGANAPIISRHQFSRGEKMKHLLLILLALPTFAFGSGTLQVKPGYYMKAGKVGGQIGLSIYEDVLAGIHLNQWLGIGTQPRYFEDSVFYAVSETSFGTWFGATGLAVGYKFQHADKADAGLISEHSAFVKISRKLW